MKFGAHMSTSGGAWKALERGTGIGCEVVQLFVKNNMQWFGKPCLPADLAQFANQLASCKFSCVFGHTGYLINLGAPPSENREKSIQSLVQEIELAADFGLPFLVLHPGAHLGAGEEEGVRRIVEGLDAVCRATRQAPVRIALENTAGQGTCLGHEIAHLAAIYERVSEPRRLAVCLDTAHFFEAGYDIRSRRGWDRAIEEVESMIGLNEIVAFHLNDSKTDLGSRVDRHAGIGEGKIGREAFRHIVNDPRFEDLPGCLETPKAEDLREDVENLARLRALVGQKPSTTRVRVR
jgi:deoxyribonuclease-4